MQVSKTNWHCFMKWIAPGRIYVADRPMLPDKAYDITKYKRLAIFLYEHLFIY